VRATACDSRQICGLARGSASPSPATLRGRFAATQRTNRSAPWCALAAMVYIIYVYVQSYLYIYMGIYGLAVSPPLPPADSPPCLSNLVRCRSQRCTSSSPTAPVTCPLTPRQLRRRALLPAAAPPLRQGLLCLPLPQPRAPTGPHRDCELRRHAPPGRLRRPTGHGQN